MDEHYIGDIILFAGSTIPPGFAICDGSLLQVNTNQALFALLGTTYGGDGINNFALPDLRGAVPVGAGTNKTSGTKYSLGKSGGAATLQLTTDNLPAHTHTATMDPLSATLNIFKGMATKSTPDEGDALAIGNIPPTVRGETTIAVNMFNNTTPVNALNATSIQVATPKIAVTNAGNSQPISIMQPYLTINYLIAIEGMYPTNQ